MDRGIIYPGQVPLETDLLFAQRAPMIGLSKLAAALLGTGTLVNGLAVTQTTVASMNVQVAAGEIYQLLNLDATAYSSLAADTTHQVVKQGVNLDAATLALTAPGTAGFSVNYLIQATISEADGTPVVLPYYNASNPGTAYSGPSGSGTAQNTRRTCSVSLNAKAGTAATTGTQTTPSPDAGYVGIAVVTVANGASSITNANIAAYNAAPAMVPAYGQVTTVSAGTTQLTAGQAGQVLVDASGGNVVINLPLASVRANLGFDFIRVDSSGNSVTINRTGSDTIATLSGFTLTRQYETANIRANGSSSWQFQGGNGKSAMNGTMGSSIGASGYQRLPSGLILQWGTGQASTSDFTNVFPTTFPNACLSVTLGNNDQNPLATYVSVSAVTTTGFKLTTNTGATRNVYWMAVGN